MGCWYLGSTTFHAVALFCIGLIAVAMPHVVPDKLAAPPVFETPAADTPEGELARFDLGQTPEYPTKLDADTIAQLQGHAHWHAKRLRQCDGGQQGRTPADT